MEEMKVVKIKPEFHNYYNCIPNLINKMDKPFKVINEYWDSYYLSCCEWALKIHCIDITDITDSCECCDELFNENELIDHEYDYPEKSGESRLWPL